MKKTKRAGVALWLFRFDQPHPTREKLLHHALLDDAWVFSRRRCKSGDFGVHVGEERRRWRSCSSMYAWRLDELSSIRKCLAISDC